MIDRYYFISVSIPYAQNNNSNNKKTLGFLIVQCALACIYPNMGLFPATVQCGSRKDDIHYILGTGLETLSYHF